MINGGEKMKTRFLMLAVMMCMAAVTFSACSDDDDDDKSINVPESVVQALKQKYPSATGIEWEQKGAYFVADCWLDGKESNICTKQEIRHSCRSSFLLKAWEIS